MISHKLITRNLRVNEVLRKVVNAGVAIGKNSGEAVDVTDEIRDGVVCTKCGKVHLRVTGEDASKSRYVTVVGDVTVNSSGGVLGNGDWDKLGVPVNNFCPNCFVQEAAEWAGIKITFDGSNE